MKNLNILEKILDFFPLENLNAISSTNNFMKQNYFNRLYFEEYPVKFASFSQEKTISPALTYDLYDNNDKFTLFKTEFNHFILIFAEASINLKILDLHGQTSQILNAHDFEIISIQHYYYSSLRTDYILSLDSESGIKLWDFTNKMKSVFYVRMGEKSFFRVCTCFYEDFILNKLFILSANSKYLMIWNLSGNIEKKYNSNYGVFHITTFSKYEKDGNTQNRIKNNYILTAYKSGVIIYYFNLSKDKFYSLQCLSIRSGATCCHIDDANRVYASTETGEIHIFDLSSGSRLRFVKTPSLSIYSFSIWNSHSLIFPSTDKRLLLFDYNSTNFRTVANYQNGGIICIKIIGHFKKGIYMVTLDREGNLILWS
jgi:hypothetical protein